MNWFVIWKSFYLFWCLSCWEVFVRFFCFFVRGVWLRKLILCMFFICIFCLFGMFVMVWIVWIFVWCLLLLLIFFLEWLNFVCCVGDIFCVFLLCVCVGVFCVWVWCVCGMSFELWVCWLRCCVCCCCWYLLWWCVFMICLCVMCDVGVEGGGLMLCVMWVWLVRLWWYGYGFFVCFGCWKCDGVMDGCCCGVVCVCVILLCLSVVLCVLLL